MGSFSIWHWLIVLLIVVMVFGTKSSKTWAATSAVLSRASKDGMKDGSVAPDDKAAAPAAQVANAAASDKTTIDVEAKQKS